MTDFSVVPSLHSETDLFSDEKQSVWVEQLKHQIEHAAHYLPAQGPITVFVHHNTLHAFEEMPFDSGVQTGGELFGCHPYLPEEKYRQYLEEDRIRTVDLEAVLLDDLGEEADRLVASFGTRYALRLAMLQSPLHSGSSAELKWVIAETDALRKFRDDVFPDVRDRLIAETRHWVMRDFRNGTPNQNQGTQHLIERVFKQFNKKSIDSWSNKTWEEFVLRFLFQVCHHGFLLTEEEKEEQTENQNVFNHAQRHRDLLFQVTGEDSDFLVHDLLIRFCSAFLDQGFGDWELPNRDAGFYESFIQLYDKPYTAPSSWLRKLSREMNRLNQRKIGALESIDESLRLLGVGEEEQESFITQTLLALQGWAGMVWQMETNAEWAIHPAPTGSLIEFLAVRLILDRLAISYVARNVLWFDCSLQSLRDILLTNVNKDDLQSADHQIFTLFQLAQIRGWKPEDLQQLTQEQWRTLLQEIDDFSELERRRIYHLAYEHKYRNATLDAVIAHSKSNVSKRNQASNSKTNSRPAYQLVCCIDDREESFRRHLEEVAPECETFGIAGFYGVAMYYRGASDAYFKPLCPVSIKPQHYIVEAPLYSQVQAEQRRSEARRRIGRMTHQTHRGTRTFLGGLITGLFGSLAAFPLVARVLFPRATSHIRDYFGSIVSPPSTELHTERTEKEPGVDVGHIGYTIEEMADIVEAGMRALGLGEPALISDLIIICGHGSSSVNNPHESAYNCGACSGGRGGPNARVFSQMANDLRIRQMLLERNFVIPKETIFVGGYHNTCDDSMTWFDLDNVPVSHRPLFERAKSQIDAAKARSAHERCRRFESAELSISFEEALEHVEERSEDLSQARPEYNHATNGLCFVGHRDWSRGLFLDRRAFLTSYTPSQDDAQGTILEQMLRAVIPVCAGINLEYYFSTVDVEGYGCGSKLPHNITSLLGVMSGAASDLRPGLSLQMIEIHEPMRILFVIETTPQVMQRIIENNPSIKKITEGNWVQLALFDAESLQIHRYVRGEFILYQPEVTEIPAVNSSLDWYRGWRDHLGFASIYETEKTSTSSETISS
ncbi:Hypothetical transmembrane protein coupled to NADH-ubiquinone oxidoreductase chain 5 homolog [hydrothermal vent metagenome]|uniref:Hypothetical transmembrane protein coupled to NADH-ubiquinone oxidoreductase chain 5 homolog n=1 Tax=hydrothermal vent metagenome TaxID=652676 RepID=A0A3B1E8U0_9ZZZZ